MKLGKKAPRHDPRTLKLSRYMAATLPPVSPEVDWTAKVTTAWPLYQNDTVGDCTFAAVAHQIHSWTHAVGSETVIPENEVLGAYETVTGYKPGDDSTDNGATEIDVLKWWKGTGLGGHKINAFLAVDPTNVDHFKIAVALFGGCYIGLQLPETAEDQDEILSVVPATKDASDKPGSWGGHALVVLGYNDDHLIIVSWGTVMKMTWDFFAKYVDEAWVLLSMDFLRQGKNPDGFDFQTLQADIARVAAA